ncbi:MAG: phage portal protein [Pirellulaceae bacterium]|nr:phage portal protein [Pirellulaceae bacterium]
MFGWLRGLFRGEIDGLRDENIRLKAAAASEPAAVLAGAGSGDSMLAAPVNLAAAREQLRHFKGWQYVAINAIAKRVAGQELRVGYEPTLPTGGLVTKAAANVEMLPTHPLVEAINDPNDLMVRWSLLYVTTAQLELTGRAYWWFREEDGRLQIWPLPPDWVAPDHDENKLYARWIVRPPSNPQGFTIDGDDMAYFSLPDPADNLGCISPLGAQAPAVNLDEAIQVAHTATMHNSVRPGVILTAGRLAALPGQTGPGQRPNLTPEQRKQLIHSIQAAYAGMTKYGTTAIVDGLIEAITPFSTAAADVEFTEGAKLAKSRILQSYGVHEFIVGESAPSSYAQAAAVERVFCDNVVNPLLALIGQILTGWLAPRFNGPNGVKLKVWFEPCRARDDDLEFRRWTLAANKGFVTPNEFRRAVLNLPDIAGGDELPDAGPPAIDPAAVKALAASFNPYASRANGKPIGFLETAARRG